MNTPIYQIDAFSDHIFGGNPAAVCPLESWLPDALLMKITQENNLAETAFFVPLKDGQFHLRWFTPEIEMDLCGHATLASAFVIFNELDYGLDTIQFASSSGPLLVKKIGDYLELDFPKRVPVQSTLPSIIAQSLSIQPLEVWKSRDYVLLYESQQDILGLKVDEQLLRQINIDPGGIVVTAPGDTVDFVSRFFTPQAKIFEDPVTGSAHCSLVPFWSERLNKVVLEAQQLSERGGFLYCSLKGERILLRGQARCFLKGEILLPN